MIIEDKYNDMVYDLYNRLLDYQSDDIALDLLERAENGMSVNGYGISDNWINDAKKYLDGIK